MILLQSELWAAATNCYVVGSEGKAVIVDAPPDPSAIASLLESRDLAPVALLVTHGHVDHAGGAGSVVRRTGIRGYVHPADDFLTLDPESQLRMLFGGVPPGDFRPPETFTQLADNDRLRLAGFDFDVVHTPGHTPGHCCFRLADEGILFSGDQLFAGSIGRTDLPGGDMDQLARSMRDRVMVLDDAVRVLPGHGPETTIGHERRSNPFRAHWE